MDDHRSAEARLKGLLLPCVFLLVVLIRLELLRRKILLGVFALVRGVSSLFFSGRLALVLKVEPDGLLEVTLDGAALVLAFESIVDLDVDFGSVEGAIAMVEGPRLAVAVQSCLKL